MPPHDRDTVGKIEVLITDIALGDELPDVGRELEAAGVTPNSTLVDSTIRVAKALAVNPESTRHLAVLLADLLDSPHPTGALVNFLRYLETVGVSGTFLRTLAEGPPIREILATVFGSSQYMADIIIRNSGYLYWLIERQTLEESETREELETALGRDTGMFESVDGRLNAVRRFQRRQLLKIGVKDLLGLDTLESTTRQLSDLADAVARTVLRILWNDMRESAPRSVASSDPTACGFAVLALGKLGGSELNYSSDIDLIYTCRDADDDLLAFYHKLASRLTDALSGSTPEGYLYRTDLRLRPDGDSGPLVNTLTGMRIYYESRGRPWEFQAMLKARVIAGDRSVGSTFLESVHGLFFNPSLSYSPVEDIARMRTRIRENISPHDRIFNIKLMEGGIRDIEFILQTLQLLHGHGTPDLRVPNTLEGLRRARRHGLIDEPEFRTLTEAYNFLRLVEHRLQMMHQIKTHTIPESRDDIELLARRVSLGPLGRFSYDEFLSSLAAHLSRVRELSDDFFSGSAEPDAAYLTLIPDDEELAVEILARHGFSDVRQALSTLQAMAYGSFPRLVDRTTRAAFLRLMPALVEACAKTGDPNLTLVNFSKAAAASRNENAFYSLLSGTPPAFDLVRDLAGTSSLLTGKLCRDVSLVYVLLEDPDSLLAAAPNETTWQTLVKYVDSPTPANRRRLEDDLAAFLDNRILAAWRIDRIDGSLPRVMSRTITAAVRLILSRIFETLVPDQQGVAFFVLGSFGVGEPRLSSDADVLVVSDGRAIEPLTRSIQKMSRFFSETNLLKIDFRLRGEGANAPLVQDLSTYRRYFSDRMSPWERVAFAKCACWSGDPAVADAFFEMLLAALTSPMPVGALAALADMRKQLEGLVPRGREVFETKRSAGGRYDIEYLTAVALAKTGAPFPLDADTVKRLEIVAAAGLITDDDLKTLSAALDFFGRVDFVMELQEMPLPQTAEKIDRTSHYLDRTFELLGLPADGGVRRMLDEHKRRVRACFERRGSA